MAQAISKTAEKPEKRLSFIKPYLKNSFLSNLKILVVITILDLLSFPLTLISMTYDIKTSVKGQEDISVITMFFFVMAIAFTALTVLAGIIIVMNNFSYLYKKQNTDMYLALPLKTSQRFLCDYFSGLVMYLAPFLLSGGITAIVSVVTRALLPSMREEIYGLNFTEMIIRAYLMVAAAMVMFYTLSVLVSAICGSIFETIMYNIMINGIIPMLIVVLTVVIYSGTFGINMMNIMLPILLRTSPLGAAIGFCLKMDDFNTAEGNLFFDGSEAAGLVLWLLAVTAVYGAAAYLLYRKRKAEDVSKPFVYKAFYYVFMAALMLGMTVFMLIDEDLILPLVVAMVVVYLIFEVVNNRGFKKFWVSLIRCAVTVAACITFTFVCKYTEGFGVSKRVPDANDVKSVSINYIPSLADETPDEQITFTDEESVKAVIEAHRSLIDKYNDLDRSFLSFDGHYYYGTYDVEISYALKGGETMERVYSLTSDEIFILNKLVEAPDFEKKFLDNIFSTEECDYPLEISNIVNSEYYLESLEYNYLTRGHQDYEMEIMAEYAKDLAARTVDQINTPTEQPIAMINIHYYRYYIYPSDKNVIAKLDEMGIKLYPQNDIDPEKLEDRGGMVTLLISYSKENAIHDYMYGSPKSKYVSVYGWNYYEDDDYETVTLPDEFVSDEGFRELMKVAQPYYITQEPVYKMFVGSELLFIPPQYTSTAKELWDKAVLAQKLLGNYGYEDDYYEEY